MLAPHSRRILLEALRPPDGFTLEAAIATTYSLDLVALLMAPLAFSLFDRIADREGKGEALDGLAVLRAVREHAEKLTVFCDAGCIGLRPGKHRQLLTYLEDSVVPVRAPGDGAFHAKLWVLQFAAPDEPLRYRVIVPSRNLTLDRSWDTLLVLEGDLTDRTRAFADSHPLGELVESLPGFALAAIPRQRRKLIEGIAQDLRRVRFEPPDGFESVRFWVMGHDGKHRDPFDTRIDRLLVVSPFLTGSELEKLTTGPDKNVLVARQDEIDKVGAKGVAGFSEVFTLHDGAQDAGAEPDEPDESGFSPHKGLHAKLYVADAGRSATVWTGSANATHSAFRSNVEILVEMSGKKSLCGVDAVLAGEPPNLRSVLVPYTAPTDPVIDKVLVDLEARLTEVNRAIARGKWTGQVTRTEDSAKETYDVEIRFGGKLKLPAEVEVTCWPIALPDARGVALPSGPSPAVRFSACSFAALTPFFAFRARATEGQRVLESTFVVPIPMVGMPEDRQARVLEALLDEPGKVLRFMQLLLALDPGELGGILDDDDADGGTTASANQASTVVPLLETLVRALEHDPTRLDAVERLVTDLRKTARGASLLPADFDRIWEPLRLAREQLGGRRG